MAAEQKNKNLPNSPDAQKTTRQPDKRKSVRLEINAITRYVIDGHSSVGMTRLINLGGLLMEVDKPLPLASKLDVHLNLPTDLRVFSARGEVVFAHNVRNRKSHAANEVGIKFIGIDAPSEKVLKEFTQRYDEFNLGHSIYSKEMSGFEDPSILKVPEDLKRNRS